jgi:hypothetical protein
MLLAHDGPLGPTPPARRSATIDRRGINDLLTILGQLAADAGL